MPLNRPALSLGPGPGGVQDARRWVVEACRDIGRPDLEDCAELGVSELVTNALLHAQPPIQLGLRGTPGHPRVEVRDGSTDRPVLPTELISHDDDGLLLTFGRGLGIVARSATAWGADIDADGKVVWFTPAAGFGADAVRGIITGAAGSEDDPRGPLSDPVRVRLAGVPVSAYLAFQRHVREIRREVRLLSLAHRGDYPVAETLSDHFAGLDRQLRESMGMDQIEIALAQNRETTDIEVVVPRSTTTWMRRLLELLDLADEFCRDQRLLSLSRTESQHRFQQWFLEEFVRQGGDAEPRAWPPQGSRTVCHSL